MWRLPTTHIAIHVWWVDIGPDHREYARVDVGSVFWVLKNYLLAMNKGGCSFSFGCTNEITLIVSLVLMSLCNFVNTWKQRGHDKMPSALTQHQDIKICRTSRAFSIKDGVLLVKDWYKVVMGMGMGMGAAGGWPCTSRGHVDSDTRGGQTPHQAC